MVAVNQTATKVTVSPSSVTVTVGSQQQFAATTSDQFGNPMKSQPSLTWSVKSGVGTIGKTSGLYTAPSSPGTATVQAATGSVAGTASVVVAQQTVARDRVV